MRKIVLFVLSAIISICCFGSTAFADINTSEDEARYKEIAEQAKEVLVDFWKEEYKDDMYAGLNHYLKIMNTRLFFIADEPRDLSGVDLNEEKFYEIHEDILKDIECVVSFELLSNYLLDNCFYQNVQMYDSVALYKDGTYELLSKNPFIILRSRYYISYDLHCFIENSVDLDIEFNQEYLFD